VNAKHGFLHRIGASLRRRFRRTKSELGHIGLVMRLTDPLLHRDRKTIREEVSHIRPEDLAEAITRMSPEEGAAVLSELDPMQASQILVEAPTETVRRLVEQLPDDLLAAYLDILPMDDALDMQEEIEADRFEALLNIIPPEDAAEIRRLMQYPKGTVGRIMTERFFFVGPDSTISELLADLRTAPDDKYETVNDVYVLDGDDHLLGVFSLRKALRTQPWQRAREIMHAEPVFSQVLEDEEEAARRMARYGFYALPVLDDRGRMRGIFTGDDAQAILREAETEQVLSLGAVTGNAESYQSLSIFQLYRRRMPWLLILFVAESFTGGVMRHYSQSDAAAVINPLFLFTPLIIGAGGNAGAQVTTTITRALALEEVRVHEWLRVLTRELGVSTMIGASLGVLGLLRAILPFPLGWASSLTISLIVGCSLPAIVLWAASVGSLLPLLAKRARLDPAVLSAPFITTFVDATGLIIYFEIAKVFLHGTLNVKV
jgi:magnesium transporter